MINVDPTTALWRKSSRSGGNGGGCVEIATLPGVGAVRDSTTPLETGDVLGFPRGDLTSFIAEVKSGRFDLS